MIDAPTPPTRSTGTAGVSVLLGVVTCLVALSVSAVSVALPALAEDLGVGVGAASWVLSGLALTLAVGTALFGRLSDLWSLRRCAVLALLLLGVGAAVAAVGSSLPVVIAGRLGQGLGGGGVAVVALGILGARYEGAVRTRAIAGMVAVVTVVSGCGTLIGGLLVQYGSWRVAVGLPVAALLGLVPVARLAPADPPSGHRLDWPGALLVVTAAAAVLILLQGAGGNLPPWLLTAAAVGGLVAGAGLVRHVRTAPDGFLPVAVVGNRRFLLTALSAACLQAGYFTMILAAPLQLGAADDAVRVGLLLLPAALFATLVDLVAGRLAARWGRYRLGAVLAAGSAAGLLVAAATGADLAFVAGFGLALAGFAAGQSLLNDAAIDTLGRPERGIGVGTFNLLLNLGGAVAAALFGGLVAVVTLRPSIAVLAVFPVVAAAAALLARSAPRRRHPDDHQEEDEGAVP